MAWQGTRHRIGRTAARGKKFCSEGLHPAPPTGAIAQFFAEELPENFHKYNLYQLSAILVIHTAFHSWMLSHYIIADIIEKLYEDDDADLDAL